MKSIFYDIDCLVSFLLIHRLDVLKNVFDKIYMSNKVFELYTNPSISSDIRDGINELVRDEFIKIEEICLNTDEFDIYYSLINDGKKDRYIGKGEASTIALAVKHKAIVLCNDCENVGFYLEKYSLKSLNTADIIKRAYQKRIITKDDAEEIWGQMKKQGVLLPEDSFKQYLKGL